MKNWKACAILVNLCLIMLCYGAEPNEPNTIGSLNQKILKQADQIEKMKKSIVQLRSENADIREACRIHKIDTKNFAHKNDGINAVPIMGEFRDKFALGKVARIEKARIHQILGDGFLAAICFTVVVVDSPERPGTSGSINSYALDRMGGGNMRAAKTHAEERESPLIFIKGINPTADNDKIKIDIPLKVTGTKKYINTMGVMATVYVLEPIKWSDVLTVRAY